MIRFRLMAAALAVFLVAPGAAQITQMMPPVKPLVLTPQATPQLSPIEMDDSPITRTLTIEEANALIAKLKKERRETSLELKAALARINDMTKYGGSLVQAYCENETMSRNTAGASENCALAGYKCERVSGTCYRQAGMSDHCSEGFQLDGGRCVPAVTPPVSG